MKSKKDTAKKADIEPIMSWHTAWKVCHGFRNLSFKKSKMVAAYLGTNVEIWMDPDRTATRMAFEPMLMNSPLVRPRT